MIKIVLKNGMEVFVQITVNGIIKQENVNFDIDTDDDSFVLYDNDNDIVFIGKWSEILFVTNAEIKD